MQRPLFRLCGLVLSCTRGFRVAPRLKSRFSATDLDLTYLSSLFANPVRGLSRAFSLLLSALDPRCPSTDPALMRGRAVDMARSFSSRGSFVDPVMAPGGAAVPARPNLSRGSFSDSFARVSSLSFRPPPLTVSPCRWDSFLSLVSPLVSPPILAFSSELVFPPIFLFRSILPFASM